MTSAAQAKLPPELSTSVDDLKSTLHHWTDIDKVKALLKACPRSMPSKGSVIAARVRALEKNSAAPAAVKLPKGAQLEGRDPKSGPLATQELNEDQLMGLQLEMQWAEVVGGQRHQLLFGAMMLKLKANLSARGQLSKGGRGHKGEGLEGWLEKHAPKVSRSTANRLMEVAEGLQAEFKLGKTIDLEALLDTAIADLPEKLAKKREAIELCIEGKSQRQLLLQFGNARKGGKTYERGNGKGDRGKVDPDLEGATPEEQAAITLWKPIMAELLLEGITEKSWVNLPDRFRNQLKGLLIDLNKLVPSAK